MALRQENVTSLHKRRIMRHSVIFFFAWILSLGATWAQERRGNIIEDPLFPTPRHTYATTQADSASQSSSQSTYDPDYSYYGGLHQGVNVRVDLTAMAGFGSGAPRGAGFGRSIDVIYVSPLRNKWNYTLGLSTAGLNWGGIQYNDVGISGSVNYYPSENVSLALYGYKSLLSNAHHRLPFYYGGITPPYFVYDTPFWGSGFAPYGDWDYWRPNTYIGGDLNVRFNNNTWLQVHVGTGKWE